jgi:hypothetical protein
MASRNSTTAARLREILHYDPKTGVFRWASPRPKVRVGEVAGGISPAGYLQIYIDRYRYFAHRLAWLYVAGEWPKYEIDHINGNKSDNRFCNLRHATKSDNGRNRALYKNNSSGFKGGRWDTARGKWRAEIRVNGQRIHLGRFANPIHAAVAYRQAALKFHGKFAPVV